MVNAKKSRLNCEKKRKKGRKIGLIVKRYGK
jgi:hypothetical protein